MSAQIVAARSDGCSLRRLEPSPFGVMVAGVSVGTAGATTPAALDSAPPVTTAPTYSLSGSSSSTAVTTSNGVTWSLDPDAFVPAGEGLAISSLQLTRNVTTGGTGYETHQWDFEDTPAIFSFNASTKIAVLNTGTQENPVADIDVTFKATSTHTETCTTGSETLYAGAMSGSFSLVTGLTGGGTVRSTDLTIPSAVLTADKDCVAPTTPDCPSQAGTSFTSNSTPGLFADGGSGTILGTPLSFVSVARFTRLASPANATRADIASVDVTPAKHKSRVLTVTTSSAGLVTGSANLTGGKATYTSSPCTSGGRSYTVKTISVQNATYTSPAGSPIKSTPSLGPVIAAPSPATTASYGVTTVTAA